MVVHPNLRRFLRYQTEDLALALELRRAMPVEAFTRYLVAWERGLGARLMAEVRFLSPLGTPRMAARLISTVAALRDYAEIDRSTLDDGKVRDLGVRLEDYLLWKERELLPMLEVVATRSELDRLGNPRTTA